MTVAPPSPNSPAAELQQRPPRYSGEDTTPTSKREIWGWYAYGIAAEVFAVCGVGKANYSRVLVLLDLVVVVLIISAQ